VIKASEAEHSKLQRATTLVLVVMHLVSCTAGLIIDQMFGDLLLLQYAAIEGLVVDLSPILAVVLARRIGVLIGPMAILIVTIFCARMYRFTLFLQSEHLNPKGEFEDWLSYFFGSITSAGIVAWIFMHFFIFLIDIFNWAIAKLRKRKT
jgi:hypothetical protein